MKAAFGSHAPAIGGNVSRNTAFRPALNNDE